MLSRGRFRRFIFIFNPTFSKSHILRHGAISTSCALTAPQTIFSADNSENNSADDIVNNSADDTENHTVSSSENHMLAILKNTLYGSENYDKICCIRFCNRNLLFCLFLLKFPIGQLFGKNAVKSVFFYPYQPGNVLRTSD